jgi:hypothetical protein
MSYAIDISAALVNVLKHASGGPAEKFAGYAANRDFWVAEAQHCLDVIAGYDVRFARMKEASERYEGRQGMDRPPNARIADKSTRSKDLSAMKRAITDEMRRFLGRCLRICPEDDHAILADAKQLGVPTPI